MLVVEANEREENHMTNGTLSVDAHARVFMETERERLHGARV